MQSTLIRAFANEFSRLNNSNVIISEAGGNAIETLCREFMPSGSGFNSGTQFDFESSRANRLVFITSFHHMNDCGMYDGWSHHNVIVTPQFSGIDIRVTGRDRNEIKGYIADVFYDAFMQTISTMFHPETKEFTYSRDN